MANQALIQARIRTRLGNIVVRRVKPDNPNIVEVLGAEAAAVPQQAARRARTIKPKAPVAAAVESIIEPVVELQWQALGHGSCCGGRTLVATPKPGAELDVEKLRKAWEITTYGKAYFDQYTAYAVRYQAALDHLIKTGRNLPDFLYYTRTDLKAQLDAYKMTAEQYSWENCLKQGRVYDGYNRFVDPAKPLLGTTVSVTEFPGSTKTPAGLFVRSDLEPGSLNKFREVGKAANPVDLTFLETYKIPGYPVDGSTTIQQTKRTRHFVLNGQGRVAGMETNKAHRNWWVIKQNISQLQAGDVLTLIANHNQTNAEIDKQFNDCGFECVLITGNTNHRGASVLYLYEHKVTQAEIDYIKGLKKKAS